MTMQKHTIVYAEDDLDDVFILQQAFQRHDHIEVLHAPDGKIALSLLENMAGDKVLPCLVILDINMPVMNGREALQAIRGHEDLQNLPVVLFSTSNSTADKLFAESYEAVLVTKPVEFAGLESIVEQFINRCNFEINKLYTNTSYRNS
jgi:CheY-like chemotaxis protein